MVLLGCAYFADRRWFDSHFLPSFFFSRKDSWLAASVARAGIAAVGVAMILWLRPRAGRLAAQRTFRSLAADVVLWTIAVVAALGAAEIILRRIHLRAVEERPADEEPLRRP